MKESILSVQRVVKTIQPLGVRMKITELMKTAGEGRVVDLYPQMTCTLIPMQIRQILKRRSSTKDALKRGTIFMILSILSGWKRTIQSLYLPTGTHWCQQLSSNLLSASVLAISLQCSPLIRGMTLFVRLTQGLLHHKFLERTQNQMLQR